MMDYFFQRHFGRRRKRQKLASAARPPAPAVQASKARRRSSVGLPSVTLVQSRRSSTGLPPVCTDQRRRPSIGLLVASGQRRQSIIDQALTNTGEASSGKGADVAITKGRRAVHLNVPHARRASCTVSCVQRGLAVRYRRPSKVKSIESHLLGSSMLLASLVQMGRGGKEKEESREELDVSQCSCSESDEEEGSDEEAENRTGDMKDLRPTAQMHLTQAVLTETIKARPLLRPPRCLRRNSSHLLPADSVFQNSETAYGVYGQYHPRSSNQIHGTLNKPIQTSMTSPSLAQLAAAGQRSDLGATDVASSGFALHKSCSSPLDGPEGTIYYDPYQDTWENFMSYVTHKHTHQHTHCCVSISSHCIHFLETLLHART